MKTRLYSGIYYVPCFKYCVTCQTHHLAWKVRQWNYEDTTIINERLFRMCKVSLRM